MAIARALVNDPAVILADEPTGSVDQETGAGVMDLLLRTGDPDARALLVVTQDPEVADRAGRTVQIRDGQPLHARGAAAS